MCSAPVLYRDGLLQTQPRERRADFYKVMVWAVLSTNVWAHAILIPGSQGSSLAGIVVFSILSSLSDIRSLVSFFFLTGSMLISQTVPSSVSTSFFFFF